MSQETLTALAHITFPPLARVLPPRGSPGMDPHPISAPCLRSSPRHSFLPFSSSPPCSLLQTPPPATLPLTGWNKTQTLTPEEDSW